MCNLSKETFHNQDKDLKAVIYQITNCKMLIYQLSDAMKMVLCLCPLKNLLLGFFHYTKKSQKYNSEAKTNNKV